MRESTSRGLGLLAVLVIVAFAAWLYRTTLRRDAVPVARTASVPMAVTDGRLVVHVSLGGATGLRFIVDTGAERSAIAARVARGIEAPLVGRTRLIGPGGQRDVPLASLDPLRLGDLAVRRVPAIVVASALLGDYDGILGLDVLRLFDLSIDAPAGRLALLPARHTFGADEGAPLRDVRAGIVAVDATVDGIAITAVLDTGLPRTLLNAAAAAALGLDRRAGTVRRGLDGAAIPTASAVIGRVDVAGETMLEDAPVDVADAPLFTAAGLAGRPAMLLGADAFRHCAVRIAWTARRFLPCMRS